MQSMNLLKWYRITYIWRNLALAFKYLPFRRSVDFLMVKCGHCLMIYHLGMIWALSRFDPIRNWTPVSGMTNLHDIYYTAGIGKEKAPNFPFAWYQLRRSSPNDKSSSNIHTLPSTSPRFGGMGDISKPKIKIKFLHICTFGLPRFIKMIYYEYIFQPWMMKYKSCCIQPNKAYSKNNIF